MFLIAFVERKERETERQRERERDRERETERERETLICCLLFEPQPEIKPQPFGEWDSASTN